MIQRIQTIYLFIATIIIGVGVYLIPAWNFEGAHLSIPYSVTNISYIYLILAALTLISIFLFKNRKRQLAVIRLDIILNIALLGFFVYWFLNLPGETDFSEIFSKKGIGMLTPLISIVLLNMAQKAIKKDEALVKSVDRIR